MNSALVSSILSGGPLAIEHNGLQSWCLRMVALSSQAVSIEAIGDRKTDLFGNPLPAVSMIGETAIIPVKGPMLKAAPPLLAMFGAISHETIHAMLDQAVDKGAKAIIIDFDSPGGSVSGTPELSARVKQIARTTPVIAYTSGTMASAAYWVASGATSIISASSATVGSIGVIASLQNVAAQLKALGVEVNVFASDSLKSAGHPALPMTDEHRAHFQGHVDEIAAMFKNDIRRSRTGISDDSLRGQSFMGVVAFNRGLVDDNVQSLSRLLVKRGEDNFRSASSGAHAGTGSGAGAAASKPRTIADFEAIGDKLIADGRARVSSGRKIHRYTAEDFKTA